ncbi:MAG: LacI family transcriptional regulator, partial [Hyphomicrobiaceae bacterium]
AEVAARAGVSTSTVDRVINGRGGVHQKTVALVERAVREIMGSDRTGYLAAVSRLDAILAGDGTEVTRGLAAAMVTAGEAAGARVEVAFVERMNPQALADRLLAVAADGSSGIAVQALDHTIVREALHEIARTDIPVVTVLTDMAGINRTAYVGLDNRAAGRTAGYLMGRFCRNSGKLAVVWGGELYRSHEERESGFRGILRSERPDLQCLEVITSNDDAVMAKARANEAIERHRDLVGVYCVGGGITGVAAAIEEAGLAEKLVMIGHNCNSETKPHLLSGTIDALVHQDIEAIALHAVECIIERRQPPGYSGIPVEIITKENVSR